MKGDGHWGATCAGTTDLCLVPVQQSDLGRVPGGSKDGVQRLDHRIDAGPTD